MYEGEIPDEAIKQALVQACEIEQAKLDTWVKRLQSGKELPTFTFEWAATEELAAARVSVYRMFLTALEKGGREHAKSHMMRELVNGARWPMHSTSQIANQQHLLRTAVWAELAADYFGVGQGVR